MTEQSRDSERRSASIGALTKVLIISAAAQARIASVDSLIRQSEELARSTGKSVDEIAAVVVEDLERAAFTLTARTAPLVPGCGALVAASAIAAKAEHPAHPVAEAFASLAIAFGAVGLWFLTRGVFRYVGRPYVALSPVLNDIAYARAGLVRKQISADRGAVLAGAGLICLILGILTGRAWPG